MRPKSIKEFDKDFDQIAFKHWRDFFPEELAAMEKKPLMRPNNVSLIEVPGLCGLLSCFFG